jgi:hypothetical protein
VRSHRRPERADGGAGRGRVGQNILRAGASRHRVGRVGPSATNKSWLPQNRPCTETIAGSGNTTLKVRLERFAVESFQRRASPRVTSPPRALEQRPEQLRRLQRPPPRLRLRLRDPEQLPSSSRSRTTWQTISLAHIPITSGSNVATAPVSRSSASATRCAETTSPPPTCSGGYPPRTRDRDGSFGCRARRSTRGTLDCR